MMAFFILCLLPALLATTSAQDITCDTCSTLSNTCPTPPGTCTVPKAAGGCFTMAAEIALSEPKATGLSKGCVDVSNNGLKEVITFTVGTGKYMRIKAVQCSDKNNCNSVTQTVPQGNTDPNGWQCPTCFALNPDACNAQTIPCTGDETYCIDFTGMITTASSTTDTPFAGKGCATASTQNITDGTTLDFTDAKYKFTKAAASEAQKITTTTKATTATTTTKATTATTTTKATTATTSGGSPALGKFSFALYLSGLTGLLLVKLLS